jgi:hypothetical protein
MISYLDSRHIYYYESYTKALWVYVCLVHCVWQATKYPSQGQIYTRAEDSKMINALLRVDKATSFSANQMMYLEVAILLRTY